MRSRLELAPINPRRFVASPSSRRAGCREIFLRDCGGDDVQNKSRMEPLLLVAGKLSLTPAELLFVGDSRNDIPGCPARQDVLPSD